MPWSVTFDDADGIAVVRVWGEARPEDHWAAQNEAVRVCGEKRCSRLLVDLRELSTALSSTTDCLDFGQSLARKATSIRLAHVVPRDAKSKADVRFTSTVEANRGAVSREFETVEEARKWLLTQGCEPAGGANHG